MYNMRIAPTTSCNRQRAYGSLNRRNRKGRDKTGLGESKKDGGVVVGQTTAAQLNPVAHIFEPRTEDIRANFQQLRPPNHDSSDVLNIKERVQWA